MCALILIMVVTLVILDVVLLVEEFFAQISAPLATINKNFNEKNDLNFQKM